MEVTVPSDAADTMQLANLATLRWSRRYPFLGHQTSDSVQFSLFLLLSEESKSGFRRSEDQVALEEQSLVEGEQTKETFLEFTLSLELHLQILFQTRNKQ